MTLTRFRLHPSCILATINIPLSLPKAAYLPGPNAKAWSRSLRELHSDLDELVFRLGRPYNPKQTKDGFTIDFSDHNALPKIRRRASKNRAQGHARRDGQWSASMW